MDRQKMIPKEDNLEFRVKELRTRNPAVNLKGDESALYIGSGGSLQKVTHMLGLADAQHYILSDFEFKGKRRLQFGDCEITETNEDGYGLVASDPTIKFVMIDQAAQGSFPEAYNEMQSGTVVYIHTIDPFHPWTFRTFKERIGASAIGPSNRFLKKERDASEEDFGIANAVYEILMSPIQEVPFIQESEPPEEYVRRIKDTLYAGLDDRYGMAIAKAEADVLLSTPQSKYIVIEGSADLEQMDIDAFLAKINEPATGEIPKPKYNAEQILQDTYRLKEEVQGLLPKLNNIERSAIKARLQTTYNDLNARPHIEYHQQMKVAIGECLNLLQG